MENQYLKLMFRVIITLGVPSGLVVGVPRFDCHGLVSGPGQGTEVLQAAWFGQEKKKKKE